MSTRDQVRQFITTNFYVPDPQALGDETSFLDTGIIDSTGVLEALYHEIEALPDKEREVVDLLYFHGMSQSDTAAILGVTERSVRRYWTAARLKLLQKLPNSLPTVPGSFLEE